MSYAIRKDGQGWRSVNSIDDVEPDEDYAEERPEPIDVPPAITSDPVAKLKAFISENPDVEAILK